MKTEAAHTVILGAGPAGLAAAYVLAEAGMKPVVIEKGKVAGGLMRSITRGDFVVDVGRKELYNRLAGVDAFWERLLGDEYREYPHRGGILFKGRIIDISPAFRGFRRGMPWPMFAACAADLFWSRLRSRGRQPANLQEYFYQRRGRRLTQIVSQGFQEKLSGMKWAEVQLPPHYRDDRDGTFGATVRELAKRTFSRQEVNTFKGIWRHPARGTGQICSALEAAATRNGARFVFGADLREFRISDHRINGVVVRTDQDTCLFETNNVISTIPTPVLLKLLLGDEFERLDVALKAPPSSRRTIVLVYLFLNEAPRFPHAWLNVTCPDTAIGRITNYAAISSDMVPAGRTALCCEFYCHDGDPLLKRDDAALRAHALDDCARYGLLRPEACADSLVLRLPGADASQNRHNWMSSMRKGLLDQLRPFTNLYYAARTDLDIATLAGIEAAEAVLTGDRSQFDRHLDPTQLEIRSVRKSFEFKNPAEQGI
jgi:protoporphyrinogen oxidase